MTLAWSPSVVPTVLCAAVASSPQPCTAIAATAITRSLDPAAARSPYPVVARSTNPGAVVLPPCA
uniref:Secreted protein n=1 Tax=Arundo donax TaxID=35708 RepID=A0A0A8XNR9_ARUDO